MSGPIPNPIDATTLKPRRLPGRSTRKARAFEAEIARLRAEGYTFEAIQEALAAAGVKVSRTTVKREAARHTARAVAATPRPATRPPAARLDMPIRSESRSGKDIAEDFMRNRITNPLLRNRS